MTGLRANPAVRILIDRDLTLAHGPSGLVATFAQPVTVYRAFDGDEVAIVHGLGRFEGGVFATRDERKWGASWAASSKEQVADWIQSWSKRGRVGGDLFVAVANAEGHLFYREGALPDVEFDPDGPPIQEAMMDDSLCSTGLGCSIVVSLDDVTLFRVSEVGALEELSPAAVDEYVEEHPLPDVLLRNFGFGTEWYGGLILDQSVIVGRDQVDNLWLVESRAGDRIVLGAKSKKAAVDAAKRLIREGRFKLPPHWVNRVPPEFKSVEHGDQWQTIKRRGYLPKGWVGTAVDVGASYVVLRGTLPGEDYERSETVKAGELVREWEPVG